MLVWLSVVESVQQEEAQVHPHLSLQESQIRLKQEGSIGSMSFRFRFRFGEFVLSFSKFTTHVG